MVDRQIEVVSARVLRGGSIWSYEPAIHMVVDLGALEEHPTNTLPGFTDALVGLLPGLAGHTCSRDEPGGFVERLREGTWLGHVAEHVALELQQMAGHDLRRGKTRSVRGKPGHYNVVFGYLDEQVGTRAGNLAVAMVNQLVADALGLDLPKEPLGELIEEFLRRAQRLAFGPSTQAILDEATSRDIPFMRLNEASLVQLGHGVHQQRIRATMTSRTSQIAVDIASDKQLTTKLLSAAGLPVPASASTTEVDEAVAIARRIGYPVVVKPLDGNHGRGVSIGLTDDDGVTQAFARATEQSRSGRVLVEKCIVGRDYRVLVVGGRMAAIAEREPASVTGDGEHTISELVDIVNADPRRGVGHEKVLTRVRVDDLAREIVAQQGYAVTDVVPAGETVKLALTGNMSTGGSSIDRTLEAHPETVEIAEETARVVGLDIAGIDLIAPDISKPLRETGGAIVEVNAAPGFRMHTHPTQGEAQFVAKPVVDLLFPPGQPSRIPIIAVTGTNGKTTTCRMIAHILKISGRKVGMTSTDGVVIDERLVIRADASGPRSARMVLQNPRVDTGVFEVARGGLLREGLGYDRNDVGVVLNVASDHLGLGGIDTLDQLAAVKAVVVEAVPRDGFAVLNADDPRVRDMRRVCSGKWVFFSMAPPGSEPREFIERHCRRGGKAVVLDVSELGEMIVLRDGSRDLQLAWTHLLPSTFEGRARMNVANALAAAAATWVAGLSMHDIRQGLRSYSTSYYHSPGRLNEVSVNGRTVIVDYCHNAHGMVRLGEFVDATADQLGKTGAPRPRRIAVIASANDRREQDLREYGRVAADFFDHIIVREDDSLRGRERGFASGVTADEVRLASSEGARVRDVEVVPDEIRAVQTAMAASRPGDLVVLCTDKHVRVMAELERLTISAQPGAREANSPDPERGQRLGDPDVDYVDDEVRSGRQ